jgi:hypothetical protein
MAALFMSCGAGWRNFLFDTNGFAVLRHGTSLAADELFGAKRVKEVYYSEMTALLQGASLFCSTW